MFATPSWHTTTSNVQYANYVFSSAMGKSRSATCVIAYLMQKHHIGPLDALSYLRQARSIVEPNPGFMEQLELYGKMTTPDEVEDAPAYQRWMYQRELELSRAVGEAPTAEKIRFEDEHISDETADFELRCRKCRSAHPFMEHASSSSPFVDADSSIDDGLQHLSILTLTASPQQLPNETHPSLQWTNLEIAPTTFWIHCPGCDLNWSKANLTAG